MVNTNVAPSGAEGGAFGASDYKKGQPFVVSELVEAFEEILEPRRTHIASVSLSMGD